MRFFCPRSGAGHKNTRILEQGGLEAQPALRWSLAIFASEDVLSNWTARTG